jgi:hypothetical protein
VKLNACAFEKTLRVAPLSIELATRGKATAVIIGVGPVLTVGSCGGLPRPGAGAAKDPGRKVVALTWQKRRSGPRIR